MPCAAPCSTRRAHHHQKTSANAIHHRRSPLAATRCFALGARAAHASLKTTRQTLKVYSTGIIPAPPPGARAACASLKTVQTLKCTPRAFSQMPVVAAMVKKDIDVMNEERLDVTTILRTVSASLFAVPWKPQPPSTFAEVVALHSGNIRGGSRAGPPPACDCGLAVHPSDATRVAWSFGSSSPVPSTRPPRPPGEGLLEPPAPRRRFAPSPSRSSVSPTGKQRWL